MAIDYRALTEDDWGEWVAESSRAFLEEPDSNNDWAEKARPLLEFDRGIVAWDGDALVGKTHAITFSMSVPGGELPTAGVSAVTVAPTHRRRGILRELMRRQLDDVRERGEPLAALNASESAIYGRFGYGLAAMRERVTIDRRHTEFAPAVPEPPGEVRFADADAARERWPALYERPRESRPGMMSRIPGYWSAFVIPRTEKPEGGFTKRQYVEYAGPGGPEGYAIYAVKPDWPDGLPSGIVLVHDLIATTPAAEAALWRYLFGIDLVGTIKARNRSPDDALMWMLADPRRLRRDVRDHLWVRIVDVPRALEGRAYPAEGRLALDVRDPFGDWAAGRFELAAEGGQATCRPTTSAPDLTLGADDLAAIYLGGVAPATLARAGRIEGSPDALRLAGALFAWHAAPWCPDEF